MAITHISSVAAAGTGFNNGTTATATVAGTVAADDLIILCVATTNGAGTYTPSDNKGGNTYTAAAARLEVGDGFSRVYYAKVVNGGTNFQVTMTLSGASYGTIIVHHISGQDLSAPLDKVINNYQSAPGTGTNAITSTAETPTTGGQYLLGFVTQSTFTTSTFSAGTSVAYTAGQLNAGQADFSQSTEYFIQGAAASVAATFTQTVDIGTATWLVTFKAAGGGGDLSVGLGAIGEPVVGGSTF